MNHKHIVKLALIAAVAVFVQSVQAQSKVNPLDGPMTPEQMREFERKKEETRREQERRIEEQKRQAEQQRAEWERQEKLEQQEWEKNKREKVVIEVLGPGSSTTKKKEDEKSSPSSENSSTTPKKEDEKASPSSEKNSEKEGSKTQSYYVVVNRFTGERMTCRNLSEKNEWEAKFAKDNQIADRIQERNKMFSNATSSAIRQGSDRQTALNNYSTLQRANIATYGTTHNILKAGEQLGSHVAGAIYEAMHEQNVREAQRNAAAINQPKEERINRIYDEIEAVSSKAKAGNAGALMQLAKYYEKGYSETFNLARVDDADIEFYDKTIDFVPKDINAAYDLYQMAYSQKQDYETAFEIGVFCRSQKMYKEAEEWFETSLYLSPNKPKTSLDIVWAMPEKDEWCLRAYNLNNDKVSASLTIGYYRSYNGDRYSQSWDEWAHKIATTQEEKDAVCEKIASRYERKNYIAEADKWRAKLSNKQAIDNFYLGEMKNAAQKGDVAEVEKIHKRYIGVISNDRENKEIIAQIYNNATEQAQINKEEELRKEQENLRKKQEAKEEELRKKRETKADVATAMSSGFIFDKNGFGMNLSIGPKLGILFYNLISLSSEFLFDVSHGFSSSYPRELALNVPLLLRIHGDDIYAETGIQFGFPILTSDIIKKEQGIHPIGSPPEINEIKSDRAAVDIGFVAGIGLRKVGLRFIWNLTKFDEYNVIADVFKIQIVASKLF